MGNGAQGIILTTGTFSTEAKREALRDGAPPIELVDGERVVEIMEELELGLKRVHSFVVNRAFFDDFAIGVKGR